MGTRMDTRMVSTPGQLVDSLGVKLPLNDGDLVTDAVLITKVIDKDGLVTVDVSSSEACSWLETLGLVTAANEIAKENYFPKRADDDE